MSKLEKILDQLLETSWNQENRNDGYKLIEEAENLLDNKTKILDKHFLYLHKITIYYKFRDIDDFALEKAIDGCNQQIEISPESKKQFLKEGFNGLPAHTGFKQLAIIEEKRGNIQESINLSEKALKEGWGEGITRGRENWEKRIEKLKKKL